MIALAALSTLLVQPTGTPALLDGHCTEYGDAPSLDMGDGVSLRAVHDAHAVTLCLTLPPESLGSMDIQVIEPGEEDATNLHLSAAIGEWPAATGSGDSVNWGNHRDWYGPPIEFEGVKTGADGKRTIAFRKQASREIQLRKSRFGAGPWKVRLDVRAVGESEKEVAWPRDPGGFGLLKPM